MAKERAAFCWFITVVGTITILSIAGCSGGQQSGTSGFGNLPSLNQGGSGSTGSTTGATTGTGSTGTGTATTGGSGAGSTGSGTTTGTTGSGTTTGSSGSGTTTGSTSGGTGTTTGTTSGGTGTTTGTTSGGTTTGGGTPPPAGPGPVIVVLEENHDYSSVIGNSAMPYLNGLAQQYSLATQYYAVTHPSIGNYFELTAGQTITNNDGFGSTVSVDNIVRHLINAGKTWKEYSESIPNVGYTGGDQFPYVQHHNPLSYFSDVRNSAAQMQNLVPFTQFTADMNNGQLPNFSFVVPDITNDAHECVSSTQTACADNQILSNADNWLKRNIAPVISTPQFKQNGLLVIVFDEAGGDNSNGGGRVVMVAVGPKVKQAYQSTTFYKHQDLLKMLATYMGIDSNIGDAAGSSDMNEFFTQ